MSELTFDNKFESFRTFRGAQMRTDMTMGLVNKRKFRCYREFTGATVLRFTAARDFLLTAQDLQLDAGQAKVQIMTGGTPGGVFTDIPTKFCMNTIGGDVAGFSAVAAGGTFTGGTEREVIRANAGAGQGAGRPSPAGARLLGAGTFYMVITVTGTTSGVYSFEFEELDTVAGVAV